MDISAPVAPRSRSVSLWRNRPFVILASSQGVSLLGRGAAIWALPYFTLLQFHQVWLAGAVAATAYLPSLFVALLAGAATASAHAASAASTDVVRHSTPCQTSVKQVMTPYGPAAEHFLCFYPKGDTNPLDATSCGAISRDLKSGDNMNLYGYMSCNPQTTIEEEMQGATCTRQVGSGCENWVFSFAPFPDPYCDSENEVFSLWCPENGNYFTWQSVPTGHLVNSVNTACADINAVWTCEYVFGNWIQY